MRVNTNYDDGARSEEKRNAYISTGTFFGLLLLACLFLGLTTPLPIPEEIGGMVMLGETEYGNASNIPVQQVDPQPKQSQPQPKQSEPIENTEEIITSDVEDAPSIPDTEPDKPDPNEQQTEATTENDSEEITEEPKEEPRKSNPLFEFNKNDNKKPGQGTGAEDGIQGSDDGDKNATRHTRGRNGEFSVDMKGRGLVKGPPPIEGENQRLEKIVLEITVNRSGKVISAVPTIKGGGTLTTGPLVKKAIDAAMQMRFSEKANAFVEQSGLVTFNVKPK